jgi:ferredoxin-type protein NapF
VGTVLGCLSKFALFRPVIDTDKCNGCKKCARNCKAMCIDPETHTIDMTRCVACMDCLENCHQKAITYSRRKAVAKKDEVDDSRRKFVVTTAAVGAALAVEAQEKKVDGGLAALVDKQLPERNVPLKPFGAKSLKNFSSRCTGCQLCVSECPQNVLRPSKELTTMLQPEMVFDKGFCLPECTKCSHVCPTGAIKPITPEEKSAISVGHAVTVAKNCLLAQGVECNACSRHCPAAAISIVSDASTGHSPVAVNESRCIGCGACEYFCPVRPFSDIYVEGREVHTTVCEDLT